MSDTPATAAPTGEAVAHTEVAGGAEHHAVPTALGLPPVAWVSLSMLIFVGILLWKKVPAMISGMLDGQIAAIKAQLDEAKALRAEAEALRNEYAGKIANAEKDAAAMLDHARTEAGAIVAKAATDAKDMIARREKMATDKIGAAERGAVADLRARAATAATEAARNLIAGQHGATADKSLVDQSIAGLSRQ